MKFRWKLLILLLILAMVPVLVLRTFGARHLQMLSAELVTRLRTCRQATVETQLRFLANDYAARLHANIHQAETLVSLQAVETQRYLRQAQTPSAAAIKSAASGIDPAGAGFYCLPGAAPRVTRIGPASLAAISQVYGLLYSPFFLRQQTILEDGCVISRPAVPKPGYAQDPRKRRWYRRALAASGLCWSKPLTDQQSGLSVMVVAKALTRPPGVTAAVIPLIHLFEKCGIFRHTLPQTSIFLVDFSRHAPAELEVLARGKYSGKTAVKCLNGSTGQRLVSSDSSRFRMMHSELQQGLVSLQYMPYEGRSSLWTGVPAMQNIALILITPTKVILAPAAKTERFVKQFMQRQFRFSLVLLLGTLAAVVIVAVFFARTVTRPLRILVAGARRLANGNFSARAEVTTQDEFADLARVFNDLGPALLQISRMEHALAVAAEVQKSLLPQGDPCISGLAASGTSIYCEKIGGDYFDYLTFGEQSKDRFGTFGEQSKDRFGTFGEQSKDRFGVVIADVSDHGIAAALLMATARALLHERAARPGCASCDLAEINRQLCTDVGDSGRFMTLFYAEFDFKAETIRWVRAGHDPVLVYDPASDRFDELNGRGGIPLGILAHAQWIENARSVRNGQIFVFATDGIWETRNPQGEFFGKKRLRHLIRENAGQEPRAIRDAVMHAVETFRGPLKTEDDLTLVIAKYTGMSSRPQT